MELEKVRQQISNVPMRIEQRNAGDCPTRNIVSGGDTVAFNVEKHMSALIVHWMDMGPKLLDFMLHVGEVKNDDEIIDFLTNNLDDLLTAAEKVEVI